MKILVLFLSLVAGVVNATEKAAGDVYSDEVICSRINQGPDQGLDVILQQHPTWWVKNVKVVQNGVAGPRTLGHVQVPLVPDVEEISRETEHPFVSLAYRGKGVSLSYVVKRNSTQPTGPGWALVNLPGRTAEMFSVDCRSVGK